MNLQTKIPLIQQQHNQIDYHSKLLLIGSCFVENMGEKLDYFKFQTLQNPFGILFHPK
ncbi:GSCFA domain-containing protein, partial [Xanthomarina sp.]|uniref:GSCFA domain-containing protein n=1 Tax=Xanthomarina sp. TaxID=1931211 RepID=UPI002D1FA2BD